MIVDFQSSDFWSDFCEFTAVFHTGIWRAVQGIIRLRYSDCTFTFCEDGKMRLRRFTFPNRIADVGFKGNVLTLPPPDKQIFIELSKAEQQAVSPHISVISAHREPGTKNIFHFTDEELDVIWPFFQSKDTKHIMRTHGPLRSKCRFTLGKADRKRLLQWLVDKKKQLCNINSFPSVFINNPSKEQEQWHPFLRAHCSGDQSQLVSFLRDKFPVFAESILWTDGRRYKRLEFHVDKDSVFFCKSFLSDDWTNYWKETPDSLKIHLRYWDDPLFDYDERLHLDYYIEYLGDQLEKNHAQTSSVLDRHKDFSVNEILSNAQNNRWDGIELNDTDTYIVKNLFGMKGYFKVTLEYWYSYTLG